MHEPLPLITGHADTLKQRLQCDHQSQKNPRRQMLCVLTRGQALSRREVAHLLEMHRHTIGQWLARDAAGGLAVC